MSELSKETAHQVKALARFITKLQKKPKLAALLGAYTRQAQLIEDMLWGVLTGNWLENAVGVTLDKIGRIVRQPRGNSADDDEYRTRIRARVRANLSNGTVPEILSVFYALTVTDVIIAPGYPAGLFVTLPTVVTEALAALYFGFLFDSKAAGVYAEMVYQVVPDEESFMTETTNTFLSADILAGATSLPVESTEGFPAFGQVVLSYGLFEGELLGYLSKTDTSFDDLFTFPANDHAIRTPVALFNPATPGLGFGDTLDPDTGGGMAGAFGG